MKKGYKIVRNKSGVLWSYTCAINGRINTYGLGRTTKPFKKWGPLSCFEDKQSLVAFMQKVISTVTSMADPFWDCEIWECLYRRSNLTYLKDGNGFILHEYEIPRGTILASSITLTKKLSFTIEKRSGKIGIQCQ